jgi:alkanesulfonate monooxygenase SsuD/methylene tetrahydromethanopterin reductase-like flavin-dependent oxidoreductase (luciferase family)
VRNVRPAIISAPQHGIKEPLPDRPDVLGEPCRHLGSLLAPSEELDPAQYASWQGREEGLRQVTFEQMYPAQVLCGTPAQCVDRIALLREELGITQFFVQMDVGGLPQRALRDSMERFATQVIPHFRAQA